VKTLRLLPVIAVCIGFFMVVMDITIINVALPQLGQSLKGSVSQLQWVVDSYTLTFACFILTAGYFTDLFGAKKIYLVYYATNWFCIISAHGINVFRKYIQW
jgi:MFS transporter, DHA2 family, methylenomycin A resistance protein